ncbi:MAG: hypothetical protein J0H98_00490 [Solirubrobacterales bacterium]|nr:hypothetical protein [Solirubrobacterales bacterium]
MAVAKLRRELAQTTSDDACQRLAEVIWQPPVDTDGVRVGKLLAMPVGASEARADRLLEHARIWPDLRLRELTPRQRGLLAASVVNGYEVVPVDVDGRPL